MKTIFLFALLIAQVVFKDDENYSFFIYIYLVQ